MNRVLVTGADGQLGQCIQNIASTFSSLDFSFKNSKELDITNPELVNNIFDLSTFDYCINCAAYTNVEQAEKTPKVAYAVNAEGVKNVALACKKHNVFLIHISTDYVFDGEKNEPYTVEDIPNPINEYGKSKLEGEKHIQKILEKYFIVRTSWLYNKTFGKNFYRKILNKAEKGLELQITDEEIGCPTDAFNLAKYLLVLIIGEKQKYGIYHFTDEKAMSWFQFGQNILEENNLKNTTKIVKNKNRSFVRRPKYSVLRTLGAIN
jgi:dTDP-4-dehydrorhamnose reductase